MPDPREPRIAFLFDLSAGPTSRRAELLVQGDVSAFLARWPLPDLVLDVTEQLRDHLRRLAEREEGRRG